MNAVFSCREASRLASEALDHRLGVRKRLALLMHLAMCAACRTYRRQIAAIDAVFRMRGRSGEPDFPGDEVLDPDTRGRIKEELARQLRDRPADFGP